MRTSIAIAALLLVAACRGADPGACPVLHVLAAQSLEPPLRALIGARDDVRVSYGASGQLVRQMELGAPADLFLPAGEQEAGAAGARAAEVRALAANRLVLVVPRGNPAGIARPADLARAGLRVAVGRAPAVPAGRYARDALARLGLLETVAPRLVEAESAPQAVAWVRAGQADAGLVYRTDARAAGDAVEVLAELETTTPIRYPAVVLRGVCEARARALLDELSRAPVLAAHGFERP